MGSDRVGNSTSRLIVLRVPVRKRGVLFLLGASFLGLLGVGMAMLVTASLAPDPGLFWILFVTIPSALAGAIAPAIVMEKLRDRWLLAESRCRSERLRRILLHPEGKKRLPHRLLENELRQRAATPTMLERIVHTLPAGIAVMIVDRKDYPVEKPVAWSRAFDPVKLGEEDQEDRLVDMANEVLDERGSGETNAQKGYTTANFRAGHVAWGKRIGSVALPLIMGALVILKALERKPWNIGDWLCLFFYMAAFASPIYSGLVTRCAWYLIPAGVFCYQFRILQRRSRLARFTRKDSPFLFYQPEPQIAVAQWGCGHVFKVTQPGAWVAMATWMGNAEAPSVEQLRGLFAERGEK